jgi:hypothetical protein
VIATSVRLRRLDLVAENEPENQDRNRPDRDVPAEPRVRIVAPLGVGQARHPGPQDAGDVAAEIDQYRGQRPDLGDRREGGAGVVPAEHLGHEQQVAGARDRQELRHPLDDPQDYRFEGAHRRGIFADRPS